MTDTENRTVVDLRKRLQTAKKIQAVNSTSDMLYLYKALAEEAIEQLEQRITISAPPVCVNTVKWSQKPLASYSIEYGGRGKHTVEDEIPIPAGPIDIREFTCRRG